MNSLRLDKRLRAVVDRIDCVTLADIGCDHGKVAVCALLEKRAEKVFACDISPKSLEKAVALAKTYGLENIEFCVGDGLDPVSEGEVDCAVIAGMGGREIISILSDTKSIKNFILVAHKNSIELRRFLIDRGMSIVDDRKVEQSGKFYDVIVAVDGAQNDAVSDEKSIYMGKNSVADRDFAAYLEMLGIKYQRLRKLGDRSEEGVIIAKILQYAQEERLQGV